MDRSQSATAPSASNGHARQSESRPTVVVRRRPGRSRQRRTELTLNGSPRAILFDAQLTLRLLKASEGYSWMDIAELTGDHPENVRRHMNNGRVSARFLALFCQALEL